MWISSCRPSSALCLARIRRSIAHLMLNESQISPGSCQCNDPTAAPQNLSLSLFPPWSWGLPANSCVLTYLLLKPGNRRQLINQWEERECEGRWRKAEHLPCRLQASSGSAVVACSGSERCHSCPREGAWSLQPGGGSPKRTRRCTWGPTRSLKEAKHNVDIRSILFLPASSPLHCCKHAQRSRKLEFWFWLTGVNEELVGHSWVVHVVNGSSK